jgi:nuclear pore complex protein Nup107
LANILALLWLTVQLDLEVRMPDSKLLTAAGIQQALHPLRLTADRVTRQMEAFAEKLGRFKQQEYQLEDVRNLQAAYALIKGHQVLAQDIIHEISRQNTLRRAKAGWNTNRENGTENHKALKPDQELKQELKRLHLEADTWELLLNMMTIDDKTAVSHSQQAQAVVFQNLHRYSSDREIWDHFLDADHFAAECMVIMKWLEQTARSSSQDIDSLISDLETQAERGQGLWAHGWLYTKETIKGQKRLRSWPQPLEPDDPGITLSLLSSEKKEPLVTQLDPDAVTRQKQALEKQDQFYERATWLTCWKMLRQGERWTDIRKWCQERLESWRAVSLCGSTVDTQPPAGKTPVDDGLTRMMNCKSQESWRAACYALAQDPNTDDSERAVYALLCGETEPAYKVCQSWDDHLYVFYNHILLSRYRDFCKQFHRKLALSSKNNVVFIPQRKDNKGIIRFLENLRSNSRLRSEAQNPYRTIQAAIISRNYDVFFVSLANAVSKINHSSTRSLLIPDLSPTHVEDSALIVAQNTDSLRMITHLYIVARSLGYTRSDSHFSDIASVTVIGYIQTLHWFKMLDFIPLYASLLPTRLLHAVLGRLLLEIVDTGERKMQAKLIEKHKIDVNAILESQWHWAVSNTATSNSPIRFPCTVQRATDGGFMVMPVGTNLTGTDVSREDEWAIRSLEWHKFLGCEWATICDRGAILYKRFFSMSSNSILVSNNANIGAGANRLAAAKALSNRMGISEVSREVIGFDIVDLPLLGEDGPESNPIEPLSPTKSPSKTRPHRRQSSLGHRHQERYAIMYQQSQRIRELEQLIIVFHALEKFGLAWLDHEVYDSLSFARVHLIHPNNVFRDRSQDAGRLRELKDKIQLTFDFLTECIEPLLSLDWLTQAKDSKFYPSSASFWGLNYADWL